MLFRSVSQSRYVGANGWDGIQNLINSVGLSDSGYAAYLGTIYTIFGKGVIIPRLIKALLGIITPLLKTRNS